MVLMLFCSVFINILKTLLGPDPKAIEISGKIPLWILISSLQSLLSEDHLCMEWFSFILPYVLHTAVCYAHVETIASEAFCSHKVVPGATQNI